MYIVQVLVPKQGQTSSQVKCQIQKNTFSLELTTGQRGKACAHNSRPNQEIAEHAVNRKESNRE